MPWGPAGRQVGLLSREFWKSSIADDPAASALIVSLSSGVLANGVLENLDLSHRQGNQEGLKQNNGLADKC